MPDRTLYTRLRLDQKDYQSGINKAKKQTSGFGNTVKKLGATIGATFAASKFAGSIQATIKQGVEAQRMSKRLGVGVEALQRLTYVGKQFGIQSEAMRDGLKELSLRADEFAKTGSGPAAEVFERLGFTKSQVNQMKGDTEALFTAVQSKIQGVQNTAAKQRIADELFGGQGGEQLVQMISQSSSKLEEMKKSATGVIPASTTQKMVEFDQKMKALTGRFETVKAKIVTALMPALQATVKHLSNFGTWLTNNIETIKSWVKTAGIAAGIFLGGKGLVKAFSLGKNAVKAFRVGFKGLNATMKANIIFAIASAVFALTMRIRKAWKESETFRARVKHIWASIKYYFGLAKDYVSWVATTIWESFKAYFSAITDLAKTVWNSIKAVFDKDKSPAEVFKEGLANIKDDLVDTGKEAAEGFKEIFEGRSKPNYDKILKKEQSKQKSAENGKEAGKKYAENYNKTVKNSKPPEMPKRPSEDISMPSIGGGEQKTDLTMGGLIPEGADKAATQIQKTKDNLKNYAAMSDRATMANVLYGKSFDDLTAKQQRNINMQMRLQSKTGQAAKAIKGAVVDMAAQSIKAFGNMAAAGDMTGKKLVAGLLKTLAGLMERLGKMAIAIGIGIEGIKKALQTLNPAAAIAAGVALLALSGAVTAAASNLADSGGGGNEKQEERRKVPGMASGGITSSPGTYLVGEKGPELVNMPTGARVTPNNKTDNILKSKGNEKLTAEVSGDKIRWVLDRTAKKNERLKG